MGIKNQLQKIPVFPIGRSNIVNDGGRIMSLQERYEILFTAFDIGHVSRNCVESGLFQDSAKHFNYIFVRVEDRDRERHKFTVPDFPRALQVR